MGDEFSQVYGAFTHTKIDTRDIGKDTDELKPLVELLERTYIIGGQGEQLVFSRNSWRPSLVARSDAELYDVEQPRWAKRVYVTVEDGLTRRYIGFLNIRALEMFKARLDPCRRAILGDDTKASDLICSAYLSPPRRLIHDGFRFPVVRDIGVYLNELGGVEGTIFASPIGGWGGMCSQACVYMASYLMITHGSKVLGISDITFAASGKANHVAACDIPIRGLNSATIQSLFPRFLHLSAFHERTVVRHDTNGFDVYLLNRQISVLADYLDQGFPVIVLVKGARLVQANDKYYTKAVHGLFAGWTKEQKAGLKQNLHAIVLTGYRAPQERDKSYYQFAYHDSLSGPYLSIRADQLLEAAYDTFQAEKDPLALEFVVPFPKHVTIPLAPEIMEGDEQWLDASTDEVKPRPQSAGLFNSSYHWKTRIENEEFFAGIAEKEADLPTTTRGYFRLQRPGGESHFALVARKDFFDRYISLNVEDRDKSRQRWWSLQLSLPDVLWIEEFGPVARPAHARIAERAIRGFWGWPACGSLPPDLYQKPILQATNQVLQIDGEKCHGHIPLKRDANAIDVRKTDLLGVGAITSFHVGSLVEALRCLAYHRIQKVDLYAFPLQDLRRYFPNVESNFSLLEVVAGMKETKKKDASRVAALIATDVYTVSKDTGHSFLLNGFATYFPEISSPDREERRKAVKALQNIIRVAGILRRDYGHDMRFVEAVAGTKLSYPKPVVGKPPAVHKADYEEKFRVLCESLVTLSRSATIEGVCLSIEVEPGLLPFLSSTEYIEKLTSFLDDERKKGACGNIGINVDVSHMWLCDIESRWFVDSGNTKYISHVHVNDTGPAHLCDLVPGTIHVYDEYKPWFDLFYEAACNLPREAGLPDFSCCLSVELEACRETRMIGSAYYRTKNMLSRFMMDKARLP